MIDWLTALFWWASWEMRVNGLRPGWILLLVMVGSGAFAIHCFRKVLR